ncbi:MAG: hypothetical protein IKS63_03305 [Firmicutes bacterium]|nr:hypothetical protein [Bacillota bacterium]
MNIIKLKVENESDLYNPFDMEGKTLSDDVKNYIMEKLQLDKSDKGVEIRVFANEEIDRGKLEDALNEWVDQEEGMAQKSYRRNLIQQLFMFIFGLVFIVLSILLESKINVIWSTILSTIGAFSIWESCSIWIVRNPKLKIRRRIIKKLRTNHTVKIMPEE